MDESPSPGAARQVTKILQTLAAGRPESAGELLPLVYEDLRRLAASRMARLAPGQTLQATALVHEAYVRLVGSTDPGWQGRVHFFAAAARAMRDVVANQLESKATLKRGGNLRRVDTNTMAELSCAGPSADVMAVEEVLEEFERDYPRKAEVVTLMFYGGLAASEIAEVLEVSERTVERDWRFARSWLNGHLEDGETEA